MCRSLGGHRTLVTGSLSRAPGNRHSPRPILGGVGGCRFLGIRGWHACVWSLLWVSGLLFINLPQRFVNDLGHRVDYFFDHAHRALGEGLDPLTYWIFAPQGLVITPPTQLAISALR